MSWVASKVLVLKFLKCGLLFLYFKNWLRYCEICLKFKVYNILTRLTIIRKKEKRPNFTKYLRLTMFFFTLLTTFIFTKTKDKLKVPGPMSNVLHDTPAIKWHQTLSMIYPFYYISMLPWVPYKKISQFGPAV